METSQLISETAYLLNDPVEFKLSIGKRKFDAQFISARFVDGLGYFLKIKFNDGHEDEYELDDGRVNTADGKVDGYCVALEKEIYTPLWAWSPRKKVYVVNFPINNKDTNIWIIGDEHTNSRQEYFVVYYSNEFHFQIKKEEGQWKTRIPEAYEDKAIDKDLLKKIISVLNYYTA